MEKLKSELQRGIQRIVLADVENRNALGLPLVSELYQALLAAEQNESVRAVLITNEGTTFCAGANLKERSGSVQAEQSDTPQVGFEQLLKKIQTLAKPVIGRIAGHAVGGGMGLVAALDISIADEDAKFGFTEVRLGVAPAIISVVCLPKLRRGEAMEAFLRGNRFSGARAAELGLITRAVPAAQLDAAVEEVMADVRLGGPVALGFCKQLVNQVPTMPQDEAFAWTAEFSASLFEGAEAAAGYRHFWRAHRLLGLRISQSGRRACLRRCGQYRLGGAGIPVVSLFVLALNARPRQRFGRGVDDGRVATDSPPRYALRLCPQAQSLFVFHLAVRDSGGGVECDGYDYGALGDERVRARAASAHPRSGSTRGAGSG